MVDEWLAVQSCQIDVRQMYKEFSQINKEEKPPKCISQDPVRKTETMQGNSNREN